MKPLLEQLVDLVLPYWTGDVDSTIRAARRDIDVTRLWSACGGAAGEFSQRGGSCLDEVMVAVKVRLEAHVALPVKTRPVLANYPDDPAWRAAAAAEAAATTVEELMQVRVAWAEHCRTNPPITAAANAPQGTP